jgi:polysaccharide export outer membrane protein
MWFLLVALAVCGCQSGKEGATVLSFGEFSRHFSGNAPATNAVDEAVAARPKIIAPGMQISVSVAEDGSLNRQFVVPPSGFVDVPGAGRLMVTGLTADEVADKIRAPLERDFFKKATVGVVIELTPTVAVAGNAGVVYVLGSVNRPGPLLLPAGEAFTVMKVILGAGGFGSFADGGKVRLIRYDAKGKKYETRLNMSRIMKEGEFERDLPVQNGDYIIVPEKWISF